MRDGDGGGIRDGYGGGIEDGGSGGSISGGKSTSDTGSGKLTSITSRGESVNAGGDRSTQVGWITQLKWRAAGTLRSLAARLEA